MADPYEGYELPQLNQPITNNEPLVPSSPPRSPTPDTQTGYQPQTGTTPPPLRGPLNTFDVFSLIVNKMIGTGIFTAPAQVLLATQSKQLALGLWALGFVYTIMSMFLYLDYAVFLPYTGGELIYLDEITSNDTSPQLAQPNNSPPNSHNDPHIETGAARNYTGEPAALRSQQDLAYGRKPFHTRLVPLLGNGLMAYVLYAFLFVAVFNSGTNCMQTAREILIIRNPNIEQDRDLVRFIGVIVLSVICAVQVISANAGRKLNRMFAIMKIGMLFVLFIAGARLATNNTVDFTKKGSISAIEGTQAVLIILYSFEGWENANFVAGEINFSKNPNTLRNGFISAVVTVGLLYFLLNAVFLNAISYDDVYAYQKQLKQFNYPAAFFGNRDSLTAQRAWAVLIAISAAGNVNTVVYTFSRVKQAIGLANVLPWSAWWKREFLFKTLKPYRSGAENPTTNPGATIVSQHESHSSEQMLSSYPRSEQGEAASDLDYSTDQPIPGFSRGRRSSSSEVQTSSTRNSSRLSRISDLQNDQIDNENTYRFTPIGGLTLEWISTVVGIAFSSAIPATLESISLPGNIQAYSHCFFLVLLGFGLTRLKQREEDFGLPAASTSTKWRPSQWRSEFKWPIVAVYCSFNIFILAVSAKYPSTSADNPKVSMSGHVYPIITFTLTVVALLYYAITFFGLQYAPGSSWHKSIIKYAGVSSTIVKTPTYDLTDPLVYRFGARRTIDFVLKDQTGRGERFIYWFFGGQELQNSPPVIIYSKCKEMLEKLWYGISEPMKVRWGKMT